MKTHVPNVQNQYKDIAHMIEKRWGKKIRHYVRTDFIHSPILVGE